MVNPNVSANGHSLLSHFRHGRDDAISFETPAAIFKDEMVPVTECRFCRDNELLDDAPIAETKHLFVLASRDPKLTEAVMIIPKQHFEDPFEMGADEWADMPLALDQAKSHLARFAPDGYSLGWNVGTTAGQTVDHVHLHVIARHKGDAASGHGLRGFLKDALGR